MKKKSIFIHIPKTGGTTINCAINNSKWQTKPDFYYRHIDYQTKRSNSADIFNPMKYDQYKDYTLFMLLRDPVDRIISEYSFIRTRPEFMSLIKPYPNDLVSYIKNKQTQNYMIGFLLGKRMYDTDYVTREDLDYVKNAIRNLDIKVGIFEHYASSLEYFSQYTKLKWPKNIDVKRITLNRPKLDEISNDIKKLIIERNALDVELYNTCLEEFQKNTISKKKTNISFNGDRYDYVLKFTERFNLLEIEMKNLEFIHNNKVFFDSLNMFLHQKVNDGKTYVSTWNKTLMNAFIRNDANSKFSKQFEKLLNDENIEPIEKTIAIAKIIDKNIKPNTKQALKYKGILTFNPSEIVVPSKKKRFKWF